MLQKDPDPSLLSDVELFDVNGRCLPRNLSAPVHVKTRHYFKINPPNIDAADIFLRCSRHLGAAASVTVLEFSGRIQRLLEKLKSDSRCQNITHGVVVPFFIPKSSTADMGDMLERIYIPAVNSAYIEKFPTYSFTNHCQETLQGKLAVAAGTRHDKLIQLVAKEDVVGCFFPCLLEYSVPATREIIPRLPEQFLLAGGVDTCAALIAAPDLLFNKKNYPPLLWFAALDGDKPEAALHLEAYGYNLTFNKRCHFGQVAEYWATGLVVLG